MITNRSTGPAAYLADLLESLGQVTLENGGTFLSKLLDHRADLEYLDLSHANNNVSLAYIDLVNEVMEAYIYSKLPGQHADRSMLSPIAASPATDQFLQLLDHVKTQVHERAISAAVYPATVFPYNRAVDRTRHLLAVMGTNLADPRVAMGNCHQIIRKRWPSYQSFSNTNLASLADQVLRRSIATETLGLLEEDLIAITGERFETEIYQSAFPPGFPSNCPRYQGVAC
ncbi:hypothetical protein N7520_003203 [Penicillium odoratum]|uniref:uncharacterized protein n=1 Tax=Penicillium odoratum TaxID=1167516 RepID=UPI002548E715|nr:uncharacterized protein N7520_003203 [Penicillium odoratum]KAJ5772674.1 hypothetical protein N7520_003203 [Penicillium odoratum]